MVDTLVLPDGSPAHDNAALVVAAASLARRKDASPTAPDSLRS
jgi:uncharacterized protein (DUF849 family)